jgi:probable HAF family extracellular repeat protein
MLDIGTLPEHVRSSNTGVNADGTVVVGASGSSGGSVYLAYRWTRDGGMVNLNTLPGYLQSSASAVSSDGLVVVGSIYNIHSDHHAFRWTAVGGMVNLGTLPGGTYSVANAVSGDGSVVVGGSSSSSGEHGFLWNTTLGMVDLNTYLPTLGIDLTGWTLYGAHGISADGRTIVGIGDHNGVGEAWIATLSPPPPCPGDLNDDNAVSLSDLTILLAHFGTPGGAAYAEGDLDADGDVDLSDLATLLANFGTSCP